MNRARFTVRRKDALQPIWMDVATVLVGGAVIAMMLVAWL